MMNKISAFLILSAIAMAVLGFAIQDDKKPVSNSNLTIAQIAGRQLFDLKDCSKCHTLADKAVNDLTPVTDKRNDTWFAKHVEEESSVVLREEKSERRRRRVLSDEIVALDEFLYNSEAEERKQIENMPENIKRGAYLAYQHKCYNCHAIAGFGKDIGPELSKVGNRHEKDWLIKNLKDPKQFAPETLMPPFGHLPEEDLERMAEYLKTLK